MKVKELKDFLNTCDEEDNIFVMVRSQKVNIGLYEHEPHGYITANPNFDIEVPNDNTIWLMINI